MRLSHSIVFVFLLSCLVFFSNAFAAVQISATPNQITLDEQLELRVDSDRRINFSRDQLSKIEENFEILNRYSNTSVSIINGKVTSSQQRVLILQGKKTGIFTIPRLDFGSDHTQPIDITVTAGSSLPNTANGGAQGLNQNSGQNSANAVYFSETQLGLPSSYVTEENIVTHRIYCLYPFFQSEIEYPQIDNADIVDLGKLSYETDVNGQKYYVNEFQLAMYPKISGEIEIPSARIKAMVNNPNRFNSHSLSFGQRITENTPPALLNVKSIPTQYNNWFSAKTLDVQESWSSISTMTVGETMTRNIEIYAQGMLNQFFPKFSYGEISNLKIYPNKAVKSSNISGTGVHSSYKQSIHYIPTQTGSYIIPQISINWWDSMKQTMQTTILPSKTIVVLSANGQQSNDVFSTQTVAKDQASADTKSNEEVTENNSDTSSGSWINAWPLLFALILLGCLSYLFWKLWRRLQTKRLEKKHVQQQSLETDFDAEMLSQYLKSQDFAQADKQIILWAKNIWPREKIDYLHDIKAKLKANNPLFSALQNYERHRYAANASQWNYQELIAAVDSFSNRSSNAQSAKASAKDQLPKLYL